MKRRKQAPLTVIASEAFISREDWIACCKWWHEEYLPSRSHLTKTTHAHRLTKWNEWLNYRPLKPDMIQAYINDMHAKGMGRATIKDRVMVACQLIRHWSKVTGKPFLQFADYRFPPAPPQKEKTLITRDQFDAILRQCTDLDLRLMFSLMWHGGMSIIDACSITPESIHMDQCFIIGNRSKSGTEFRIPFEPGSELHRDLELALEARKQRLQRVNDAYNRTYLMPDLALKARYKQSNMSPMIRRIFAKAGVEMPKGELTHAFRRSYCSALANSGIHPSIAMKSTGHKSIVEFHRYVKPNNEAIREGVFKALSQRELQACNAGEIRQTLFDKTNETAKTNAPETPQ